jgi:hypothetical protein
LRDCGGCNRTKNFKSVHRALLDIDVALCEHVEEVRRGVGPNCSHGLLGLVFLGTPRFGIVEGFKPKGQRFALVGRFGSSRRRQRAIEPQSLSHM